MEILSDSSIDKTFETQSLSATGGIEESISDAIISSEKDHYRPTSFSDNVMGSNERTIKSPQSMSESEASQTQSASSAYSHHLGTPTYGTSSISSSPSSDSSNGEGTVDPSKYFLKRCIRAAHRNSKKQSSMVSDPPAEKPFEAEFCNSCIQRIRSGNQTKAVKPVKPAETAPLVDQLLIEKLKFERLIHSMRKVTTKQELRNDKQNCKVCRNWKNRLDETAFLRENIRHLRKQLTEWRLQQHLITMDPVNQIGDLASGLPKVSDPPQEVWEKLQKK